VPDERELPPDLDTSNMKAFMEKHPGFLEDAAAHGVALRCFERSLSSSSQQFLPQLKRYCSNKSFAAATYAPQQNPRKCLLITWACPRKSSRR
jgi:hypothetical protein